MISKDIECSDAKRRSTFSRNVSKLMRDRKRIWPILFLFPAVIVVGFFAFTLIQMARYSLLPNVGMGQTGDGFTIANYIDFLGDPFYLGYLIRSLWISLYCTTITLVLGYVIAYAMYRFGPAMRVVAATILIVQFFTAYVIRIYAVMLVIGKTGIFNNLLLNLGIIDDPLNLLFSQLGVSIGLVLISLPFMVLPIFTNLQRIPHNLELAAASLGATRLRLFWEVIFPLTMPGVAAGTIIVYLFEMTSYIVPSVLGGGYVDMIANLIYDKAMNSFNYPFAAAAAVVTLLVATGLIYCMQKLFSVVTPRAT